MSYLTDDVHLFSAGEFFFNTTQWLFIISDFTISEAAVSGKRMTS